MGPSERFDRGFAGLEHSVGTNFHQFPFPFANQAYPI